MFKVGDIVRSKKQPGGFEYYVHSNSQVQCRVTNVREEVGRMWVEVLAGQGVTSMGPFLVSMEYFNIDSVNLENK